MPTALAMVRRQRPPAVPASARQSRRARNDTPNPAELAKARRVIFRKGFSQMLCSTIARPIAAQVSAEQALVIARERFGNLAATGILGSKHSGPAIDPVHVERALAFL